MKKILAFLLVLVMGFSFTACGEASKNGSSQSASNGSENGNEAITCYSFGVMTGGAAWGQFEKGFYDACAELGWEGHYLAPTVDNNMSELINLHETAITNGADVLLPLVVDADAMADILDGAVEQGIPMVGVIMPDKHVSGYIGTNSKNLGYNIAEALVEVVGDDEINVVTMQTTLSTDIQTKQVDAFVERLMELRPDATVISREECNSSAQTAQDKLSAVCIAHPETNALVSFDSYAGLGAATYVEAEGIADSFYAVGIDDAKEILMAVRDGWLDATVAQMWYNMGYESVMLANDVRNGKEIPTVTDSGTSIVLPSNVEDWAAQVGTTLD